LGVCVRDPSPFRVPQLSGVAHRIQIPVHPPDMTPDGAQSRTPGPGRSPAVSPGRSVWGRRVCIWGSAVLSRETPLPGAAATPPTAPPHGCQQETGRGAEREKKRAPRRLAIRGQLDLREWPDEDTCRPESGDLGRNPDLCRVPQRARTGCGEARSRVDYRLVQNSQLIPRSVADDLEFSDGRHQERYRFVVPHVTHACSTCSHPNPYTPSGYYSGMADCRYPRHSVSVNFAFPYASRTGYPRDPRGRPLQDCDARPAPPAEFVAAPAPGNLLQRSPE
jgi:hypothetical protein